MPKLTASVTRGASWLLIGRFLSQAIGFVSMMFAARFLTPEDVGLAFIAITVMTLVGAILEFPTAAALIHFDEPTRDDYDTAWTLGILRGLVVSGMLLALAWPIAQFYGDERLFPLMLLVASYPLILGLRNAYMEEFARELVFSPEAFAEIAVKLTSAATIISIAYLTGSYWAIPIGLVASGGAGIVVSFILKPKFPRLTLVSFKRIFNYSLWLGLSHIFRHLTWQADGLFVGTLGKATMGFYSYGTQLSQRVSTLLTAPINRSLFSAFSSIQKDGERLNRAFLLSMSFTFALMLPLGFGMSVLAEPIVRVMFGEKWMQAAIVLALSGPVIGINNLNMPAAALAMSLGRTKLLFWRNFITFLLRITPLLWALALYGLEGVLWSRVGTAVLSVGISLWMVKHMVGITILDQFRAILRSVMAGAVMYLVVYLVRDTLIISEGAIALQFASLCLVAGIGAATYASVHALLWLAQGRPLGPETKVLDGAGKVLKKVGLTGNQAAVS
ncbi:MAG: lipopolysaccharide biosynthesis protein [Pseudomonadota bacterium]